MLAARNVSVRRGGRTLLDSVSVQLKPGSFTCLVGPNGAGKTTLLRVLAGEIADAQQAVEMNGRALAAWDLRERACIRAVLSQSVDVAFPMPVMDVVGLGRIPHGGGADPSSADARIARLALRRAGARGLSRRGYSTLSGGEKQRVQLARALAQIWEGSGEGATYLLLDEPTAAMDLAQQHKVLRMLRRRAAAGTGVLVILHDLALAARYADQVVVLHQGRVVESGLPEETLTPETIAAVFAVRVRMLRTRSLNRCVPVVLGSLPQRRATQPGPAPRS